MAKKPTCEELEQKVEELKNKFVRCKEEEEASQEMEKRFKDFLDNLGDLAYEADCSGKVNSHNIQGQSLRKDIHPAHFQKNLPPDM